MATVKRNKKTGVFLRQKENMVLRTVFLPAGMDQALYDDSIKLRTSKGDLIRKALDLYMNKRNKKRSAAV